MNTFSEPNHHGSPQQTGYFSDSESQESEHLSPAPFQDSRPETLQLRSLQEAANNSPQVMQLKALQAGVNHGMEAMHGPLQRKTASPQSSSSDAPLQLARKSPAGAIALADAEAKSNPHNRGAMTNDWINSADEAATCAQWDAKSGGGTTFYSSQSISGGGQGRPNSIDLKKKSTGASEADFIFHLPVFNGIPDMILYLMASSGIRAKSQKINQLKTINLGNPTDFQLDQIEQAPKMDISDMTNHPIYDANSAEILAHDPNFLTSLASGTIDPGNTALDGIRADPRYVQALGNKKAREAKAQLIPLMRQIAPFLPPDRSTTDYQTFGAVRLRIPLLDQHYPIAKPLLSQVEDDEYTRLRTAFDHYEQVRTNFEQLEQELIHAFDEAQDTDQYDMAGWRAAVAARNGFGARYTAMKADLTAAEKRAILDLLAYFREELKGKKPGDEAMDVVDDLSKKRNADDDEDDGGGESKSSKKQKQPHGPVPAPTFTPAPSGQQ